MLSSYISACCDVPVLFLGVLRSGCVWGVLVQWLAFALLSMFALFLFVVLLTCVFMVCTVGAGAGDMLAGERSSTRASSPQVFKSPSMFHGVIVFENAIW